MSDETLRTLGFEVEDDVATHRDGNLRCVRKDGGWRAEGETKLHVLREALPMHVVLDPARAPLYGGVALLCLGDGDSFSVPPGELHLETEDMEASELARLLTLLPKSARDVWRVTSNLPLGLDAWLGDVEGQLGQLKKDAADRLRESVARDEDTLRLMLLQLQEHCTEPLRLAQLKKRLSKVSGLKENVLEAELQNLKPARVRIARREQIMLVPNDHELVEQGCAVLAAHPRVYVRAGKMVEVSGHAIHDVTEPRVRSLLTEHADIVDPKNRPAACPLRLSSGVLAAPCRGRELRAIVDHPIAVGGRLLAAGYHSDLKILIDESASRIAVPREPTDQDVERAKSELLDVVGDFPFMDEFGRAVWLASVLTAVGRAANDHDAPLFVVTVPRGTNMQGQGKTKASKTVAHIAGMETPKVTSLGNPEELERKLGSFRHRFPVIIFDNVKELEGEVLASLLTSARGYTMRQTRSAEEAAPPMVPNTFFATGNAIRFDDDLKRRCVLIRLNDTSSTPRWQKTNFKYPHLEAHVWARRDDLVGAALTLLLAYQQRGTNTQLEKGFGSFEGWDDIRRCVIFAGLPDPAFTAVDAEAYDKSTASARSAATMLRACGATSKAKKRAAEILKDPNANEWVQANFTDAHPSPKAVTQRLMEAARLDQTIRQGSVRNATAFWVEGAPEASDLSVETGRTTDAPKDPTASPTATSTASPVATPMAHTPSASKRLIRIPKR